MFEIKAINHLNRFGFILMSSNIYDFNSLKKALQKGESLNLNDRIKSEENLNFEVLMRVLENPEKKKIFESYVKQLSELSNELGRVSSEFNEIVNAFIQESSSKSE